MNLRKIIHILGFTAGLMMLIRMSAAVADSFDIQESSTYGDLDRSRVAATLRNRGDLEVIVLGNSHAGAIDKAAFDMSVEVLNRAFGDIFEIQLYAETLLPRLPRLKRLYIALSHYSIEWDNSVDDTMKIRRIYAYSALPPWTFRRGDGFSFLIGKLDSWTLLTHVIRNDSWRGVWRGMLSYRSGSEGTKRRETMLESECGTQTEASLDTHARSRVGSLLTTLHGMKTRRTDIREDALRALTTTIASAQRRGIEVVLFTPPYWKEYNRQFSSQQPELFDDMSDSVGRIAERMHVPFVNHSDDPEFTNDAELFMDSDHLNQCGAQRFTDKLNHELGRVVPFMPNSPSPPSPDPPASP